MSSPTTGRVSGAGVLEPQNVAFAGPTRIEVSLLDFFDEGREALRGISVAFLFDGRRIGYNPTPQLFTTPSDCRTEAYFSGRFG